MILDIITTERGIFNGRKTSEYKTQTDSISYLLRYIRTVLSPKEYQVICCRYGLNGQEPLTQREIAENLSISRSYVSRIEKNALRKLRTLFPENQ